VAKNVIRNVRAYRISKKSTGETPILRRKERGTGWDRERNGRVRDGGSGREEGVRERGRMEIEGGVLAPNHQAERFKNLILLDVVY